MQGGAGIFRPGKVIGRPPVNRSRISPRGRPIWVLEVAAIPGYVYRKPDTRHPRPYAKNHMSSVDHSTPPHRHTIALVLGGIGLFLLGAVVGTVSLHFWMGAREFPRNVPTAAFIQDWQLNCPPIAQSTSGCNLRQTIVQQGSNTPLAMVQIERGVSADTLKIVVPLGVLVGPGLAFSANGSPPVGIPYITCDFSGCIAVTPLTSAERTSMESGTAGRITVVGANGKSVALPFSLKGFGDAMRERDKDWRRRSGHWF